MAEKSAKILESKNLDVDLSHAVHLIAVAHDFGKATTFFQDHVKSKGGRTEKRYHSSVSALFCYYLISESDDPGLTPGRPLMGWYVVQRHHGNLTDLTLHPERGELAKKAKNPNHIKILKEQVRDIVGNNLEEVKAIYEALGVRVDFSDFASRMEEGSIFKQIRRDFYGELEPESTLETYYELLFLYSILLDSDKLDAAGVEIPQRKTLPSRLVDRYREINFGEPENEIDGLRARAASSIQESLRGSSLNQRLFSITLPTGMGKTLTGLETALTLRERVQRERGFTPRVIYSLPFLTIIEQNYGEMEKVLKGNGLEVDPSLLLKHHYLSMGYMADDEYDGAREGLLLTEGWHSEMIVTTFVQFFESLVTHRNSRARKFHNMANSVILLDEVQAIPRKYWELLREALRILGARYNSWIILMTATNPLIFEPGTEIKELVEAKDDYYTQLDRIDYVFSLEERELEALRRDVVDCFQDNPTKDIMVVMNTINSSKKMYSMLKETLEDFDGLELIYLSTHIIPMERMGRIDRIKGTGTRKVIVSTQLIEAGVDIDVDIIFRDFAPLDSAIQTAGRCNREDARGRGRVNIIRLRDEGTGRNYCSYIYDSVLLDITEEIIDGCEEASEGDFNLKAANEYFNLCKKRSGSDERVLESIEKLNFSEIQGFRLIEEVLESVSVFIECDEEAEGVRRKVEDALMGVGGYKKRAAFLPLKRDFYRYVLNIRVPRRCKDLVGFLREMEPLKGVYIVERKDLDLWYDKETGFKFPEETIDMRII